MQSRIYFVCTLAILTVLNIYIFSPREVSAENPGEMKVGFVNLKTIFKDYQEARAMERQIQQEAKAETAQIRKLEEEASQLREEIQLYRVGSSIRKRKEKELTEKLFRIKHDKDRAKYFALVKLKSGMEKIYQKVNGVIEDYAKKNNFFMILKVADADFFDTNSNEALHMEIKTRDVLYWDKKYDITQNISDVLNKKS